MLVISPHLDDAVFSCGALLAAQPGSVVLTLFAGLPDDPGLSTDWDRRCGFANAGEAMSRRLEEDDQSLHLLEARSERLSFLDAQYGDTPDLKALEEAIHEHLRRQHPHYLCAPMGLFHSDHLLAARAALAARLEYPDMDTYLYEDMPYRAKPGLLSRRLCELCTSGLTLTPAALTTRQTHARMKARALLAYASQLGGIGDSGLADLGRPERLWSVASSPAGSQG